ncbi:MAG: SGNH/GDSL hydrolase family protein [Microcella sp.]|nr:SGNH/GDSL hydrolase family protein [Microcella sp.]
MTSTPRPLRGRALSRAVALALAPVLVPQTVRLRRTVPKLPEAPLPWEGGGGTDPIRLLVLGDSMAVGVGVDDAADGLAGHLAAELTERTGRPVRWRARGRNGATARDVIDDHLTDALREPADLVFLSIGANDAMQVRSHRAFRRDVRRILHDIFAAHPDTIVLIGALPAFHRFGLLPEPLRSTLYLHTEALEVAARRALERFPRAHMTPPLPPYSDGFFASDDFHPSAQGYREWAAFVVDDAFHHGIGVALAQ